jgi:GAF domain-containing protein
MTVPDIQLPSEVSQKWQEIVDLLANILHVPAALVMKVEPPSIRVLVSSKSNGNPYQKDEVAALNTGLYCETVMKTRQSLLVSDARADEDWKSNPDVKVGMVSYLGFPITWPDGKIFGTICVLDTKRTTMGMCTENSSSTAVMYCKRIEIGSKARCGADLTKGAAR